MRTSLKPLALVTTLALTIVPSAATLDRANRPADRPALSAAASTEKWEAQIIPAEDLSMGSSLPYGPNGVKFGAALDANGIDNYWAVCGPKCHYDFAVLLFSNFTSDVKLTFKVVGPNGATVYSYSWSAGRLIKGTSWWALDATGDFSATGTYEVELLDGSDVLGWVPMIFAPA